MIMDNDRKLLTSNKPHLLGKHYPAPCSVPTLTEQGALFPENFLVNYDTFDNFTK
jgi:hypothetical protein